MRRAEIGTQRSCSLTKLSVTIVTLVWCHVEVYPLPPPVTKMQIPLVRDVIYECSLSKFCLNIKNMREERGESQPWVTWLNTSYSIKCPKRLFFVPSAITVLPKIIWFCLKSWKGKARLDLKQDLFLKFQDPYKNFFGF